MVETLCWKKPACSQRNRCAAPVGKKRRRTRRRPLATSHRDSPQLAHFVETLAPAHLNVLSPALLAWEATSRQCVTRQSLVAS